MFDIDAFCKGLSAATGLPVTLSLEIDPTAEPFVVVRDSQAIRLHEYRFHGTEPLIADSYRFGLQTR